MSVSGHPKAPPPRQRRWSEPRKPWLNVSFQTVQQTLRDGLPPVLARASQALLEQLAAGFMRDWPCVRDDPPDWALPVAIHYRLFIFLSYDLEQQTTRLDQLRRLQTEYGQRYRQAVTEPERQHHLLTFAHHLGASRRQRIGDRRAFQRWLGYDALAERCQRQRAAGDRRLAFVLERLGFLTARLLKQLSEQHDSLWLWRRLGLEARLLPLLAHDGDPRVRIAAFHALATVLHELPAIGQTSAVAGTTLRYLYGAALDHRQAVWIQTEALELLEALDPPSLATVLNARFTQPGTASDDLFVRRRAALLVGRNLQTLPVLLALLPVVQQDPSPYVRQGLAESLPALPLETALLIWQQMIRDDPAPPVRAAALLQIAPLLWAEPAWAKPLCDGLTAVLDTETDAFVLRVALREIGRIHQQWLEEERLESLAQTWRQELGPAIARLHGRASSVAVRRWAAQTREHLWAWATPERRRQLYALAEHVAGIPVGYSRRLPRTLASNDADLGRLLALLAQNGHGFDLRRNCFGAWLTRGQTLGFRAWRWLYEIRHPATDKRQAFRHTVGRIYHGNLRVPSTILAELAETKVPGEPLLDSVEAGWRPYLPLVDELISSLDQWNRTLRRYTSEGVTEIVAPRALWRRLRARTVLTVRFAGYARLRNWREGSQQNPAAYLQAIVRLGFTVRLLPYPVESGLPLEPDPLVKRFFPSTVDKPPDAPFEKARLPLLEPGVSRLGQGLALWPAMDWARLWERFREYFFSAYQNSLFDLSVFLAVAGGLFFGQHVYATQRIRRARRRRALVMGGWGTRGKSGTERLKAALINALGFGVVSKTTGCEAMFLHAYPFGPLKEMFLFRPYDKATIWEQGDVLRLADRLHAEVFLWECMGLTPAYVHILQRQWMRDDVATITNTYPDHEDIQGPAGYNIPEVMTEFIPARSLLLTSEEQMLPILRDAAGRLGTEVRTAGWLEAGLLTEDVLERFPYEEHPYNIALVLALAEELGVARDFALKEMADRVVLDIGVLKRYPRAQVRNRGLEFINGMSANERFGCLNNWQRMRFDRQDPEQEPGVWITTVVNNRADRIPRSRVFAGILVADLSADRHFLIGTNLDGLQGYIREAWEEYIQSLSLWPDDAKVTRALQVLKQQARWQRIPTVTGQLTQRLTALLKNLGVTGPPRPPPEFWRDPSGLKTWLAAQDVAEEHGSELAAYLVEEGRCFEDYQALAARVASSTPEQHAALDQAFHEHLWRWFARKLVVIRDAHASGEQIIARIVQETPPGMEHRLMGIQNIKGPGLDFVYRWQAWETCRQACQRLRDADPLIARQGLQELAHFQEFGALSAGEVRETLALVRDRGVAQNEYFQAELTLIESNLQQALDAVHAQTQTQNESSGLLHRVAGAIEAFLDAGDAIRRRRLANRIYRDLTDERISRQRAALELRELIHRQKGGWLEKRIRTWLTVLRGDRIAA